jgi:ABC-type antimicrobial peptide transport system permease subunit
LADDVFTIVGVVGDVRNVGLTSDTYSEVYVPYTVTGFSETYTQPILLVTSRIPPMSLAGAIQREIHSVDPDQPVMQVRTVETLLNQQGLATPRFGAFLFGAFACLGLLLSAVGVYGVVNYSVSRQLPGLGIRMALGANRRTLFGIVLCEGLRLILAGIVGGGLCGLAVTRLMSSVLWRVSPLDPLSFGAATAILFTAGVVACLHPAWRATRADPMIALRHE